MAKRCQRRAAGVPIFSGKDQLTARNFESALDGCFLYVFEVCQHVPHALQPLANVGIFVAPVGVVAPSPRHEQLKFKQQGVDGGDGVVGVLCHVAKHSFGVDVVVVVVHNVGGVNARVGKCRVGGDPFGGHGLAWGGGGAAAGGGGGAVVGSVVVHGMHGVFCFCLCSVG